MRIIIVLALGVISSPGFAFCNPATPQSLGAYMDCLDTEREGRRALDNYRDEAERRIQSLERERRFNESMEEQSRIARDLRDSERLLDEQRTRYLDSREREMERRFREPCRNCE